MVHYRFLLMGTGDVLQAQSTMSADLILMIAMVKLIAILQCANVRLV